MCSTEDPDSVAIPRSTLSIPRTCMKCKEAKPIVVIHVNDAFCRDCFVVYVVHKFRSTIGKSHMIRDGEKVLLAFSGGPASSGLLQLVREGLSVRAHKRLRFVPGLLHVHGSECPDSVTEDIIHIMQSSGYPSFITSLDQGLEKSTERCWDVNSESELEEFRQLAYSGHVKDILKTMKTISAKEDFVKNLRNQLLATKCHHLGYQKVMVADTSSRLAVRILSDIAQGRGSQVSMDTSFADKRYGDVLFCRPLRELTIKEVAMYNRLYDVKPVTITQPTTMAPSVASIDHLTEYFVTSLQSEFPSTVSNITRTANKLENQCSLNQASCRLCQAPLEDKSNDAEYSAVQDVKFSEWLSRTSSKVQALIPDDEDSLNPDDPQVFCYGCRLTVKDIADKSMLPDDICKHVNGKT